MLYVAMQCSLYLRATLLVPLELISRTTGTTITPLFQKDMVYNCGKGGVTSMFLELLFFWLPDFWLRELGFVFFYLSHNAAQPDRCKNILQLIVLFCSGFMQTSPELNGVQSVFVIRFRQYSQETKKSRWCLF